jgi:hypothetical protein
MSTLGIPPSTVEMTSRVMVEGVGAAVLLGLGSAAIPYGMAVRSDPVDSLRAVG